MEFCFVNNDARLSRPTQKFIRSHVMKGKNLGKVIPKRGERGRQRELNLEKAKSQDDERRLNRRNSDWQQNLKEDAKISNHIVPKQHREAALSLEKHFCGAEIQFISFPIPITPSLRYLLHECRHLNLF